MIQSLKSDMSAAFQSGGWSGLAQEIANQKRLAPMHDVDQPHENDSVLKPSEIDFKKTCKIDQCLECLWFIEF